MRYDDSLLKPPGPVVPVAVRPTGRASPNQNVLGELDTGSDITVIPESLAMRMRLSPEQSVIMTGYDGTDTKRDTYLVDLEVADCTLKSLKVVAAPRTTILLGRDILNHFIITLDGKAQTFEMIDP